MIFISLNALRWILQFDTCTNIVREDEGVVCVLIKLAPPIVARYNVTIAGIAHYNMVRIHPFDDGNARRRVYLQALSQADAGDMMPFLQFIAESMLDTQSMILKELGADK